jgi:hypothetical protein
MPDKDVKSAMKEKTFNHKLSILSLSTQSIMWMPHIKSQIRHCSDLIALISPENGSI